MDNFNKYLFASRIMILFVGSVCICSVFAAAETNPENYFGAHSSEHLWVVEEHHLKKAIDKMGWENLSYAWDDIDFILDHFPNHPKALMMAIELSLKVKKYDKVAAHFKRAIYMYPKVAPTYIMHGIFFHKKGNIKSAIEQYKKAVEVDPEQSEAFYNLGLAYMSIKKYEQAYLAAKRAYSLGYPLPGLKQKLKSVNQWPDMTSTQ